jgi:hypothetical protein
MIARLLVGSALMALCVVIHAAGVVWGLRTFGRLFDTRLRFWRGTGLFILIFIWIVLLHLTEISVWAAYYSWRDAIPDPQSALYFSAVTYTTTGYGDIVLPEEWRLLGAIEALTGILMCGWSTGFYFALVNRVYAAWARTDKSSHS